MCSFSSSVLEGRLVLARLDVWTTSRENRVWTRGGPGTVTRSIFGGRCRRLGAALLAGPPRIAPSRAERQGQVTGVGGSAVASCTSVTIIVTKIKPTKI